MKAAIRPLLFLAGALVLGYLMIRYGAEYIYAFPTELYLGCALLFVVLTASIIVFYKPYRIRNNKAVQWVVVLLVVSAVWFAIIPLLRQSVNDCLDAGGVKYSRIRLSTGSTFGCFDANDNRIHNY